MVRSAFAVAVAAGAASGQVMPTFAPAVGRVVPGMRANGKIELGDVSGDGRPDAVLTDLIDERIRVMLQRADGAFEDPVVTTVPPPVADRDPPIALGDIDRDGRLDLGVGLYRSNLPSPGTPNFSTFLSVGDGTFAGRRDYNNQPGIDFPNAPHDRGMLLADVNRDGILDLVTASNNDFINNPGCKVSVLLGDGLGGFGAPILSGMGHCTGTHFLLVADVSGDQNPDVVSVANTGSNSHARTSFIVNLGDGSGRFTGVASFVLDMRLDTGGGLARVYLRDADGDGKADLFANGRGGSQSGAGGVYVRRSAGDGTFPTTLYRQAGSTAVATMGVEDLNGDGRPDLILPGYQGAPGVVRVNDGSGGFGQSVPLPGLEPGYEFRDLATGRIAGSALPSIAVMAVDDIEEALKLYTIVNTTPVAAPCYANCDGSTVEPVLNVNDFLCFLARYAAADPYANCDGSTAAPVLNVNDFVCFGGRFAAGCP